ncbi:MAG TPA: hypothetical protein VF157_03725, partial [Chloroflexota bacterium]
MQLDEALSQPASRAQLVASTISRLRAGEPPDLLVSAGTEALVLTSLVAAELGLPMVYVRPEAKGHGRQKRLEGEPRGSRAAVISGDEAAADDCRQEIESSGVRVVQVLTPATPAEVSPQEVARILLDIGAVII